MLAPISRPALAATTSSLRRANQLSLAFSTTRLRSSDKSNVENGPPPRTQPSAPPDLLKQYHTAETDRIQNKSSQSLDTTVEKLRVWSTKYAAIVRQRMDTFSASAQIAFSRMGGRLNEVTGYREIEQLKRLVVENGAYIMILDLTRVHDTKLHLYESRKKNVRSS